MNSAQNSLCIANVLTLNYTIHHYSVSIFVLKQIEASVQTSIAPLKISL